MATSLDIMHCEFIYRICCRAFGWGLLSFFLFGLPNQGFSQDSSKPTVVQKRGTSNEVNQVDLAIAVGNHRLAGTVYLPISKQLAPAVVFVHGAGPVVRNEDYRDLASYFAQHGIAALIYDKQGCGASTGDWTRAGMFDLAEDALACVKVLRNQTGIDPKRIGLWGLSQGASIIPITASRSRDVAFLMAVGGCLDFDEQMRYFRANVIRTKGLPQAALDIANKVFAIQIDLGNQIRRGGIPAPQSVKDSCRFEFDLDQESIWQQVHQPILAVYGEKDRHVPVAVNVNRLTRAVQRSGNPNFSLIIYPNASHSIGQTRTGELGEDWIDYVPQYLPDMTDWVLQKSDAAKPQKKWTHTRNAPAFDFAFSGNHYDQHKWYGNVCSQSIQFMLYLTTFVIGTICGVSFILSKKRPDQGPHDIKRKRALGIGVATLSAMNLVLLGGLVVLARGLSNAWNPDYPAMLTWLPLLGICSFCLTMMVLFQAWTVLRNSVTSRRSKLFLLYFSICAIAYLPFLYYWNLLGLRL